MFATPACNGILVVKSLLIVYLAYSQKGIERELVRIILFCFLLTLSVSYSNAESESLTIQYGYVTAVEVTTRESAMARNMLIGSLVGLAIDDSFSGAMSGATAGFVLTSIIEGDKRIFAYTLKLPNDSFETIAVDRPDLNIGHCAALERDGKHVNLRPVSAVHCESNSLESADHPAGEHRQSAAEKCSAARSVLEKGGEGGDVREALREMRAYCD